MVRTYEVVVKLLLLRSDVLVSSDKYGRAQLWLVVVGRHEVAVKQGVAQSDLDVMTKESKAPLWVAAVGRPQAVVRLLLDRNDVDVNSKDTDGGYEAGVNLLNSGFRYTFLLLICHQVFILRRVS
jgi:hypothetical protein